MHKAVTAIAFPMLLFSTRSFGQSYKDSILRWQHHYKAEFLTDPRSPVKGDDTAFIRFFPVNDGWNVLANVKITPEAKPFDMTTHSGKTKKFRQWAILTFKNPAHRSKHYTLSAYERVDPPKGDTISPVTLFIPFNDETNSVMTYGGGRYMDIPKSAVENSLLRLDFNKAYNPYCAFGEGFSCPIPPPENKLPIAIEAGEMIWTKKSRED